MISNMSPENFCYWLQGWFELNQTIDHQKGLRQETLDMVKDHLDLVFNKVTPNVPKSPTPQDTRYCNGLLDNKFTGALSNSLC